MQVKKHMVGFEMLSGPMRDLTPEKVRSFRFLFDKFFHFYPMPDLFRTFHNLAINPLSAGIFTFFEQVIRGQSVAQGNMGRNAPRYPPWGPGL